MIISSTPSLKEVAKGLPADFAEEFDRGFCTADEIASMLLEVLSDAGCNPVALKPLVQRAKQKAIKARRALQKGWPAVTACDRLDDTFTQLEASGILARQNFSGAGGPSLHDIAEEMESAIQRDLPVRGYAFYTEDDTESVARCGKLLPQLRVG